MAEEKCFVKYEQAATEDLREHIKENCSKLESCFDTIKKEKENFDSLKSELANYDDYIDLLTRSRPPPDNFVNPSSFSFMSSLPSKPQTLNDIYDLSHYYYGASDGVVTTASQYFGAADKEIEKKLNSGEYNKEYPDRVYDSAQWLRGTIELAKAEPEIYFGDVSAYGPNEEQKLNELKDILTKIAIILGTPGGTTAGLSRKCAQDIWKIEQKQKVISADELGQATTGRGELGDLPLNERVDALENLVNEVGEGTGSDVELVTAIPREFKEQCAMLALIFQLAQIHQQEYGPKKVLPYEAGDSGDNSSLLVDGQPYGFINKLTQYGSMVKFFEATNAQLAHLQPTIRLFKVVPVDNTEEEVEFVFDTYARQSDVESVFKRKDKRGFGIGLQSFNFKYEGSNPFSVKKSIRANLSIKANNFSELLDDSRGFRYIDLALKTGKAIRDKTQSKELDFRIKAVVGLAVPDGETTANFSEIRRAVENNFITLNLTPVTHTFDFDETGAVTFNVEYYAYLEEFFDKARMNIFAETGINKRVIARQLGIKTQKKNCTDDDLTKLNEFIEKDAEQVKKDKIESLQFLTNELLINELIYYLNLSKEEFDKLSTMGPFFKFANIKNNINVNGSITQESINKDLEEAFNAKVEEQEDKNSLKNSFKISGIDNRQIPFFFLGDLLDIILEKIGKNLENMTDLPSTYTSPTGDGVLDIDEELKQQELEILTNSVVQFKKLRIVLGPVEIVNHQNPAEVQQVSLADIPISLAYFNEWLTSKLLAKNSANYPLTQFLNDLINNLVKNFLNDDSCYNFNVKQKTRLFQSVLTSYRQPGQEHDDITTLINSTENGALTKRLNIDEVPDDQKPILNIGGHRTLKPANLGPQQENHFFVFYAGRTAPPELLQGIRENDEAKGVFHYIMGRDRGIVKTIELSKTDSPGLKEVRFEQEGYQGLYQLREIYDVNINTFCNIHAFPGTYIYVEPRGFSPSLGEFKIDEFDLTDLGIGGYYMIISSEHEFGPGVMNTSITAKWVQSLDAVEEEKQKEYSSTNGSGDSQVKKCGVRS
jgi:hypothetical protein